MQTKSETPLTRQVMEDAISQFEERFVAGRAQQMVKRKAALDASKAASDWADFAGGQAYSERLTKRAMKLDEVLAFATAPEVEASVTSMRDAGKPVTQGMSRVLGLVSGDLPDGLMVALRKSDGAVLDTVPLDEIGKYQIETPCTNKELFVELHNADGQLLLQDGASITLRDGETVQRDFAITRCGDVVVDSPDENNQTENLMPDLMKSNEKDAMVKLRPLREFPIEVNRVFNAAPRGTVIGQDPEAGTVLSSDSLIKLTISEGAEPQKKMPDLIGESLPQARATLTDFEYGSLAVDYVDAPEKVGLVVKQSPKAGSPLADNAKVLLCIGQAQKLIPDVVGKPVSAARAILVPRIVPDIKTIYVVVTGPPGLVEKQSPSAGSVVTDQTEMVLEIGKAPEMQDILMPDLKGQTVAAGRKELKTRGNFEIDIKEEPSDIRRGLIFGHVPEARSPIKLGDLIVLNVSTGGEERAVMPKLTGLSIARVRAALIPKYTNDIVVEYASSNQEAGIVIDQSPKAGKQMVVGAPVTVTVAQKGSDRNTPVMPDLTGLKITEAKRRLAAVNIRKLEYEKLDARKRNWQIVAQDPTPGASLRGDETVIVKFGPKT